MSAPKTHGFATLLSVIILGAVGVAVVVALIQIGLGSSRTSFVLQQSLQARSLADACAEQALETIRSTPAYTGTATITLGNGSCTFTVVNTGGTTRSVDAEGTVGTVVRRVALTLSTVSPVAVGSWQEVAD